jgi:hypothetical protein
MMNDQDLDGFYDVFGHLPVKYNRKFAFEERLRFDEHFPATRTLIKDTGECPENKVLKGMKKMTIVFYAISLVGVVIQATDIVPGIPDRITFSVIVLGLVAANLMQWRQAIKDRESNRQDLAKMHTDMMEMAKNNQEAIQEILIELKK